MKGVGWPAGLWLWNEVCSGGTVNESERRCMSSFEDGMVAATIRDKEMGVAKSQGWSWRRRGLRCVWKLAGTYSSTRTRRRGVHGEKKDIRRRSRERQ